MLEIDAALDGPWEALGQAIQEAGREDASGARRYYAAALARREYATVTKNLDIDEAEAERLRGLFVEAFGEPQ